MTQADRAGRGDIGFSIILAIQVLIIFIVAPLSATGSASFQLIELLRFGLAATTILIIARRRLTRAAVGCAFAATLMATLHWRLGETPALVTAARLAITIAFDATVAGVVGAAAFGPGRVTVHRILGAVILYLYVALVFAGLYRLLAMFVAGAFTGLPADNGGRFGGLLYFSLSALTTYGSGDIVAMHPLVRSLSSLEAVIGQLFPATLLARLVTLHTTGLMTEPDE